MKYKVHYPYISFIIDNVISIDDFFESFHLSKKTIHLLKQNKEYTLNKKHVSSSSIMVKGDVLCVKAFEEDDNMYPPVFEDIDIVYEDDFLLIVNKPPFINIYPDDKEKTDSLSHYVSGYYKTIGLDIPVRYIHRLDFETSGMVVFCKCSFILPLLDYQLSIKEIKRQYLAIVEGNIISKKVMTIDKPIGKDRHHSQRMRVSQSGKEAKTSYKCLGFKKNLSLIECQLFTGRKHQIRVHMSHAGYPLLGDKLYGRESSLINRQALHAYKLELTHPITKEKMTLTCHPPYDMSKIIQSINPTL